MGDVGPGDVVQVSYGYGLFTGGLGAHDAAGKLGAVQLPTSAGNSEKQIMLMKDFGSTALCCTPSYALHLCEVMEKMGIKKEDHIGAGGQAVPGSGFLVHVFHADAHVSAGDIAKINQIVKSSSRRQISGLLMFFFVLSFFIAFFLLFIT